MLKLPAFMHKQFPTGETVTVFQDDAQLFRFYMIPGFPTIRRDPNGNPVFQLIKFNFSDEAREDDPELGRGGGYMVFDSELMVKKEHQEEITEELQRHVNQEWERLKNLPDTTLKSLRIGANFTDQIGDHWSHQGHEGRRAPATVGSDMTLTMPGPGFVPPPSNEPPPKVVIGEPLWKSGKVTMNAPASAGLVSNKIGERPASLIGNNVAAFSLDLTPDGATFMQQTLVGRDGRGATDLTPIQVVYELTMLAKLPPAKMHIRFNTASLYHAVQELFHEHTNCSDDYFTSENMMTMAIEAGLVDIKIDTGGVTDEDIVQMLMQQATATTQELIANRFAKKERAPLEEWATEDVAESSSEIYRLKRITEVDMTNFEQTMELNTTTEYKIAPQGTLQAFFTKVQDMSPFVRVVDTNADPFFKTLGLKARAFAKWDADLVSFVEMEIKYEQGGQVKVQSFTFTKAEAEPKEWDPALINGKREFQYRWRVGFEGRAPADWSKWEKTTTRNLNVSVETPGKLDVEVTPVGLDFDNILDAALVHLRYGDTARGVPMASKSVLLAKDRASGKWERLLFAPWDKAVEYKVEYLVKNGTTVTTDWTRTDGPTQNILVPRPDVDALNLTFLPAWRSKDVVQSVLSVRYVDGDYQRDQQFKIKTPAEFAEWAVLLKNKTKRKFDYRVLATFNSGDVYETEWLSREGDQAVPVEVLGPPRLDVKISGAVVDYATTPVVKVDLEYNDPQGTRELESYSLQKKDDIHTWSLPIRKDGPRNYRRKVTYFPTTGAPIEREWEVKEDELWVVESARIPKVGAEFLPTRLNFTVSPAVEVNIAYNDPQSGVQERETLVFTANEKQQWFLPVKDGAPRSYEMTVTWFLSDGSEVTSTPVTLEKDIVTLPPAPKAAVQPPA